MKKINIKCGNKMGLLSANVRTNIKYGNNKYKI